MTTTQRLHAARTKLAQLQAAQGTEEVVLAYAVATIGLLEATLALEKSLERPKPKATSADLARLLVDCARASSSLNFPSGAYEVLIAAGAELRTSVYPEDCTAIDSASLTIDGIWLYAQTAARAATPEELAKRQSREAAK